MEAFLEICVLCTAPFSKLKEVALTHFFEVMDFDILVSLISELEWQEVDAPEKTKEKHFSIIESKLVT